MLQRQCLVLQVLYPSVKTYHWDWRARWLEAALSHLNTVFGVGVNGGAGVATGGAGVNMGGCWGA